LETVRAVERRQVEGGSSAGTTDVVFGSAGGFGPDDEVVKAVAVDVSSSGDRPGYRLAGRFSVDPETIGAVESGEVDVGIEAASMAEHDIACSCVDAVRVDKRRTDDQVVEAVAVDVACRGYREACIVPTDLAADLEAVGAIEARQLEFGAEGRHGSILLY